MTTTTSQVQERMCQIKEEAQQLADEFGVELADIVALLNYQAAADVQL